MQWRKDAFELSCESTETFSSSQVLWETVPVFWSIVTKSCPLHPEAGLRNNQ